MAKSVRLIALLTFVALLLLHQGFLFSVSAETPPPPDPHILRNVTAQLGLANNRIGEDRAVGQAWGDFDNDGWQDLYITDTEGPNTLFRNVNGKRFERVASDAVALPDAYSGGAIFADYDNDGWQDLYVLNWGQNVLFRNVNGAFIDVSAEAGVAGTDKNSQTASWGDYDQDGLLDLYVANWSCFGRCGRPQTGEVDRLYHNNGDGTFEDVTNLLGGGTNGAGFVASFVDFDNDRDLDIYLVNDEFVYATGNKQWRNDGPGCDGWCFTEISKESGSNSKLMGMGLATADYDRDGDFDVFYSNAGPMELLQNDGTGSFVNVAGLSGVEFGDGIGWGNVFFDYDNDGWQDLYVATMDGTDGTHPGNPLFRNLADGTFEQVLIPEERDYGRSLGVASADFDQDGDVDLILGNIDDGYHLLRNEAVASAENHWLSLRLRGDGNTINRDAVGARVYLRTGEDSAQMQDVTAGSSLGAGNDLALHFGLGRVEQFEAEIVWPDGRVDVLANLCHGERYEIAYGANSAEISGSDCRFSPPDPATGRLSAIIGSIIGVLVIAAILVTNRNPRNA